jgi:hypothetical protein
VNTIEDGGRAFPEIETTVHYVGDDGDYTPISDTHSMGGMTLRDYFASKAMNGLILNGRSMDLSVGVENALAELSYRIADAMLAAREVQP